MKPSLLVIFPIRPRAMEQLHEAFEVHDLTAAEDPQALVREVGGDIRAAVTVGEVGIGNDVVDSLPKLEVVGCFGVGVDAIDLDYCRERNVRVTNTPDVLSKDVADMGLGLTLIALRQLASGDRYVRAGKWPNESMPLATSATGKTMGNHRPWPHRAGTCQACPGD